MITDRGVVNTPVFMPVGTAASVKSLDSADIEDTKQKLFWPTLIIYFYDRVKNW